MGLSSLASTLYQYRVQQEFHPMPITGTHPDAERTQRPDYPSEENPQRLKNLGRFVRPLYVFYQILACIITIVTTAT